MASGSRIYPALPSAVRQAALQVVAKMQLKLKRESQNELEATSGVTLVSWGETLRVKVERQGKQTRVNVECEPSAQAFDWGKSEENVKAFLEHLDQSLA